MDPEENSALSLVWLSLLRRIYFLDNLDHFLRLTFLQNILENPLHLLARIRKPDLFEIPFRRTHPLVPQPRLNADRALDRSPPSAEPSSDRRYPAAIKRATQNLAG